ncbi:MAG: hypothetical protein M3360_03170 [Actinomycetota bacterium]|nr:hypothetical protein [Actinomycetota bacterium]
MRPLTRDPEKPGAQALAERGAELVRGDRRGVLAGYWTGGEATAGRVQGLPGEVREWRSIGMVQKWDPPA